MKKRWIVCGGVLCAASFLVGQVVAQEGGDKPADFETEVRVLVRRFVKGGGRMRIDRHSGGYVGRVG